MKNNILCSDIEIIKRNAITYIRYDILGIAAYAILLHDQEDRIDTKILIIANIAIVSFYKYIINGVAITR